MKTKNIAKLEEVLLDELNEHESLILAINAMDGITTGDINNFVKQHPEYKATLVDIACAIMEGIVN